jgi:hypothetical protein
VVVVLAGSRQTEGFQGAGFPELILREANRILKAQGATIWNAELDVERWRGAWLHMVRTFDFMTRRKRGIKLDEEITTIHHGETVLVEDLDDDEQVTFWEMRFGEILAEMAERGVIDEQDLPLEDGTEFLEETVKEKGLARVEETVEEAS